MRRSLLVLTVAALLAACATDEGDTTSTTVDGDTSTTMEDEMTTTTTSPGAGGETTTTMGGEASLSPAAITADAQTSDGTTIVVASVTLPAPGFIAVHADSGGSPGEVIGHSDLLPAGESTDVTVTLDQPLTASATVYPMVHVDVNGNGQYEFTPPDVTIDAPGVTADGDIAVTPVEITVQ